MKTDEVLTETILHIFLGGEAICKYIKH